MKKYYSYYVSEDGKVFNRFQKELKLQTTYSGYKVAQLMLDGSRKTCSVHRLVAMLYIDNPYNLSDVDHIDGDRKNNHVNNLRWMSHGDNIRHSYKTGRRSAKGENNARCKTNEFDVHNICFLLSIGFMPAQIRDMGFSYNLVRGIKNRHNWIYISEEYLF